MADQKEDDAVGLNVAAGLLQPIVDVLEGAAVGDVEQEEPAHRVTVVSSGDGPAEDVQRVGAVNADGVKTLNYCCLYNISCS